MKVKCPECGSAQELDVETGVIPKHSLPRLDQFICDASGYIHPEWEKPPEQKPKGGGRGRQRKARKEEPYKVVKCPECLQQVRKTPRRGIVGHVTRNGKQCGGVGRGKRPTGPRTVSGGLPTLGRGRK